MGIDGGERRSNPSRVLVVVLICVVSVFLVVELAAVKIRDRGQPDERGRNSVVMSIDSGVTPSAFSPFRLSPMRTR